MRDSELAASIVDGDPRALAEAYDRYADLLWSYCRSMLSDADRASEAVTDTFVIAASRLDVLPTFGRLRAWLYAVARNECLRRQRSAKGEGAAYGGAERLRRAAEVLSTGEQRQLRALLTEAFGGLDDTERDVMQMVWHGLDLAEVAAVLGISRSDAYGLFTRARDQLEASVGVLLMGWSGRGGCNEFEDSLYGRDSKLTPDLRARLSRHIAKCEACSDQYRRQMRPSLMLCLSVGALLSEAADARAAASHAPIGLWEQVYQMTSQHNPEARWHKILGSRRMSFGPDGFPRQLAAGRDGLGKAPLKVAAVGTVAVAATATGWATHGHFTARPDASTSSSSHGISAVAPDAASATPAASQGSHAGAPSTKTSTSHKPAHAKPSRAKAGSPSPTADPSALPVAASSAVPLSGGSSSPSASVSASTSTRAASGSSSASSGSGSSGNQGSGSGGSSSSASTPAAGTLSVSRSRIAIAGTGSSSFTLTAHGGPVSWSISVPSQLLGGVNLSQTSGTLAAGQSVTITVTGEGLLSLDEPLTISPGGQTVTVDVSLL
jgi:RNA polymerase sigma factor (sigma-70 family)